MSCTQIIALYSLLAQPLWAQDDEEETENEFLLEETEVRDPSKQGRRRYAEEPLQTFPASGPAPAAPSGYAFPAANAEEDVLPLQQSAASKIYTAPVDSIDFGCVGLACPGSTEAAVLPEGEPETLSMEAAMGRVSAITSETIAAPVEALLLPVSVPAVEAVDSSGSEASEAAPPVSAPPASSMEMIGYDIDPSKVYHIGPGDVLKVSVWSGDYFERDMLGNYAVFETGEIHLPLVGSIQIGGLSEAQASQSLTTSLQEFIIEPVVHVQVTAYTSQSVGVLGAVSRPGLVYLDGPKTLLQALAERSLTRQKRTAGAYAAQKVHLQRDDGSMSIIDLEGLLTEGKGNLFLRNGDMVFVTDGAYIYINGKVKKPGPVPYRDGMTITDAIAEGAGGDGRANMRAVYILRGGDRIRVDVKGIYQGTNEDVLLKEGDRLFIEESIW